MADEQAVISTRKAIKLLLQTFLNAQSALRCAGGPNVRVKQTSRVLWQDGYYERFYRWLEYALDDLRQYDKRAFIGVWIVFVETQRHPSPNMQHRADEGIRILESSPYRPLYVRVPEELEYQPRKRTHNGKREQNKEIRALASEGLTQEEIAAMYGISQGRISQILAA